MSNEKETLILESVEGKLLRVRGGDLYEVTELPPANDPLTFTFEANESQNGAMTVFASDYMQGGMPPHGTRLTGLVSINCNQKSGNVKLCAVARGHFAGGAQELTSQSGSAGLAVLNGVARYTIPVTELLSGDWLTVWVEKADAATSYDPITATFEQEPIS